MLSSTLKSGPAAGDNLQLMDAFFQPAYIQANGVDDLLLGPSLKFMQEIDRFVVDDIRNFLFGPPTATNLLDLASLNIQRGRDHGIPGYNAVRVAYGLSAVSSFSKIADPALAAILTTLYVHPDHMDPWIGCIIEPHLPQSSLGQLLTAILTDQFTRMRDGDRFWYQVSPGLSAAEKAEIHSTTLSQIISRNTKYTPAANVFQKV